VRTPPAYWYLEESQHAVAPSGSAGTDQERGGYSSHAFLRVATKTPPARTNTEASTINGTGDPPVSGRPIRTGRVVVGDSVVGVTAKVLGVGASVVVVAPGTVVVVVAPGSVVVVVVGAQPVGKATDAVAVSAPNTYVKNNADRIPAG
jgi:hypothetical protein